MRIFGRGVLGLAVSLTLILAVVVLASPPGPEVVLRSKHFVPPELTYPGIVFDTEFDAYSLGDTVRFSVWNLRSEQISLPCTYPFGISRFVDGDWRPVEMHDCLMVLIYLEPGGGMEGAWVAETSTRDADLAPVEPGLYMAGVSVHADGALVTLTAHFRIR